MEDLILDKVKFTQPVTWCPYDADVHMLVFESSIDLPLANASSNFDIIDGGGDIRPRSL